MNPRYWHDLFTGTIESEYFATEEEYLDDEHANWLAYAAARKPVRPAAKPAKKQPLRSSGVGPSRNVPNPGLSP
jgi:hypothetical protein